jgi:hypothetical protein
VISWTTGNAVTLTTTSAVTIDGLQFDGTHVTGNTGQQNANLTFTNSVFDLTAGGNGSNNFYLSQPASFTFTNNLLDATGYTGALFQPVGDPANPSHSVVTFTGNTFNGHPGTYVGGDDNNVPLILNLSDVNGTVSGNTFNDVDIGLLVGNGTGPLTISGNSFDDMHREPGTTGGRLCRRHRLLHAERGPRSGHHLEQHLRGCRRRYPAFGHAWRDDRRPPDRHRRQQFQRCRPPRLSARRWRAASDQLDDRRGFGAERIRGRIEQRHDRQHRRQRHH